MTSNERQSVLWVIMALALFLLNASLDAKAGTTNETELELCG